MYEIFKKIALIAPFFFSAKTEDNRNKCLVVIEGPSAIDLLKLLKGSEWPITYYVPLTFYPIFNKFRSKEQINYYPGLIMAIRSMLSAAAKSFDRDRNESFKALLEAELASLCFKNLGDQYKSIVVFNERMSTSVLAIKNAKSRNITSICIQHGAVVENYFPISVDKYFVWDEKFGQVIQAACSSVEIVETGRLAPMPVVESKARSNIPLVIMQPAGVSLPAHIISVSFIEIIEVCLDVHGEVALRPHPNDNILKSILKHFKHDKRIKIDSDGLIDSLSSRCTVISLYSTVLLEALYCGCLAIQYIHHSWYKEIFYRTPVQLQGRDALKKFICDIEDGGNDLELPIKISDSMFDPKMDVFFNNIFDD